MESSPETTGKLHVGDGVPATLTSCTLPGISISWKNVSTFETWEHQKTDFIRGHSDEDLCITDEMFVVHLLEVHAQLCADSLCKCRCSINDISFSFPLNPCEVSQNSMPETSTDSKAFATDTAPATNPSSDGFQHVLKLESTTNADGVALTSMLATDSANEETNTSRKTRDSHPCKSMNGIHGKD